MKRLCTIAVLVLLATAAGFYLGTSLPLGDLEKRNIAIDYACNPAQNWRMMKLFCGSLSEEERQQK